MSPDPSLLTKLGQTNQATVTKVEARAIAVASGLDPRLELNGLLQVLERKRLIDQSKEDISILGVTTRGSLGHATDIYNEAEPSTYEEASITLAEVASEAPIRRADVSQRIGDTYKLTNAQVDDFLDRAEGIGFVDKEGDGNDRLLFNGNLFRRSSVAKTQKVLTSLDDAEQRLISEISEQLSKSGCLSVQHVEHVLSKPLFEKLVAAAVYDLNEVTNEQGSHVYVTAPAAFHKFVDPMVDDCFDMAKSLVAALTYGMISRPSSQGRICAPTSCVLGSSSFAGFRFVLRMKTSLTLTFGYTSVQPAHLAGCRFATSNTSNVQRQLSAFSGQADWPMRSTLMVHMLQRPISVKIYGPWQRSWTFN